MRYPAHALANRPFALQAQTRFPVDTRGGGRRLILDLPESLLAEMSALDLSDYPHVRKLTPLCLDILESLCHHVGVERVRVQPEQLLRDRLTRRDGQARRIRTIRNTGRPFDRPVEYTRPLSRESLRTMVARADRELQHSDRPVVLRRCASELYALTTNILRDVTPAEDVCEGLQRAGWDRGRVLVLVEELQLLHWITLAEEYEATAEGITAPEASLVQPSATHAPNRCIYCRGILRSHKSLTERAGKRCLARWIESYLAHQSLERTPTDVRRDVRDWWRSEQPRIDDMGMSTHPIVSQIERLEHLLKLGDRARNNHRNKYSGWAGTPMEHQPLAHLIYYAVTLQHKLIKSLETTNV